MSPYLNTGTVHVHARTHTLPKLLKDEDLAKFFH